MAVPTSVATQSTGKQSIAATSSASRKSPSNAAMCALYRSDVAGVLSVDERSPGRGGEQRAHDGARRRRFVQRVEMDARRAAAQQIRALQRRKRHAELFHGLGFVAANFQLGEQL